MLTKEKNVKDSVEREERSKLPMITAIGTGLLFWTSLFGILFFCLKT